MGAPVLCSQPCSAVAVRATDAGELLCAWHWYELLIDRWSHTDSRRWPLRREVRRHLLRLLLRSPRPLAYAHLEALCATKDYDAAAVGVGLVQLATEGVVAFALAADGAQMVWWTPDALRAIWGPTGQGEVAP